MQCAQSIDKFGYASLRSEEVTGGTKMKARITVDSRTNASAEQIDDCVEDGTYVRCAWTTTGLRSRDMRRHQRPLCVGQI